MERAVAVTKLTKLLGKKLGYRVDPRAASKDDREAAKSALVDARVERDRLKELRDARHRAILEADSEYQSIRAAYFTARDQVEKLKSISRHYKITVGTVEHGMFLHKAEGDSWEDVIAKLNGNASAGEC